MEVFKGKGVIKYQAGMLKFCSGITDLVLKYRPKEGCLGSGVVSIKASLVKSEGEGKGFVQHLAAMQKSPGLSWEGGCTPLCALKGTCLGPASSFLTSFLTYF